MASSAARARWAGVVPSDRPVISAARIGAPMRRAKPDQRRHEGARRCCPATVAARSERAAASGEAEQLAP